MISKIVIVEIIFGIGKKRKRFDPSDSDFDSNLDFDPDFDSNYDFPRTNDFKLVFMGTST